MKRVTLSLVLILCLLIVGGALAGASDSYRIDWLAPLTGSGGSASSTNYAVSYTVGQSVRGTSASDSHAVCTGFWCEVLSAIKIYLPVILKNW
jgi:hypothetical protein